MVRAFTAYTVTAISAVYGTIAEGFTPFAFAVSAEITAVARAGFRATVRRLADSVSAYLNKAIDFAVARIFSRITCAVSTSKPTIRGAGAQIFTAFVAHAPPIATCFEFSWFFATIFRACAGALPGRADSIVTN